MFSACDPRPKTLCRVRACQRAWARCVWRGWRRTGSWRGEGSLGVTGPWRRKAAPRRRSAPASLVRCACLQVARPAGRVGSRRGLALPLQNSGGRERGRPPGPPVFTALSASRRLGRGDCLTGPVTVLGWLVLRVSLRQTRAAASCTPF